MYEENNFKPCLTKQLLNIFKLWCEWGICYRPRASGGGREGGGRGDSHVKGTRVHFVTFGDVNYGLWYLLACSGRNAYTVYINFSHQGVVQGCTRKKE